MKVLVACEKSGIVRDAFTACGHYAVSCDILPSESASGLHERRDVLEILDYGWDLMVAHPPCTHLSSSGAQYWPAKQADGRQQEAVRFFMALAEAKIPRICLENPVGFMSKAWCKPDQIIQPYWFNEPVQKKTCLWLINLPPLKPTGIVTPTHAVHSGSRFGGKRKDGTRKISELVGKYGDGVNRSRFFPGVAAAMADQWGSL